MSCAIRVLQHTATHCNTLQHTATHCNALQRIATHCNTLQHTTEYLERRGTRSRRECVFVCETATHCNTLQHTATVLGETWDSVDARVCLFVKLQHTATHCNTQYSVGRDVGLGRSRSVFVCETATHCNTLQHTIQCWERRGTRSKHECGGRRPMARYVVCCSELQL